MSSPMYARDAATGLMKELDAEEVQTNVWALRTFPSSVPGLNIPPYDEIVLGYVGTDVTTVTYKKSNVTVATLTLTYTGGQLTRIQKS